MLASSLADHWDEIDDALSAVVVSHLRCANALARACRIEESASTLYEVHARLLHAANNAALTLPARQSALRHLREAMATLLRFQLMHGARSDMQCGLHEAWSRAAHLVPAITGRPLPMTLH